MAVYDLELTRANRLRVARAFRHHQVVDFSIQCVVEDQQGAVVVDDLTHPTAYCIRVGPFGYFAGDAGGAGGAALMQWFPAYHLLMPSPPAWIDLARVLYGVRLRPFPRYRMAADRLAAEPLTQLLERSPFRERIRPLTAELAAQASSLPEPYLELSDFDSAADFVERGWGYTLLDGDALMGVAYSSLVCSAGIEVSVYVDEAYRRRGVAAALCSRLLLDCLAVGLRPNWDAANPESVRLAETLGYRALGTYTAYYHTGA